MVEGAYTKPSILSDPPFHRSSNIRLIFKTNAKCHSGQVFYISVGPERDK